MSNTIKVSKDQNVNWTNDHLQFARLIAELEALGFLGGIEVSEVAGAMDLTTTQVYEIISRASDAFDQIKAKIK